jgi:hypothetical protein
VVLTVLAVVGAALVGILVASLLSSTRHSSQAAPPATTTNAGTPKPTTSPPTTSTATSSTPTTPPAHSAADLENAVRQYYALLPASPDAAWALLTERAQRKSGKQDGYNKFWSKIKSVEVLTTKADGQQVAAALRFVTDEDKQSTEAYTFAMIDQGGRLMIDNFTQNGRGPALSDTSPPSG